MDQPRITFATPEVLRAHPRFEAAREAYIDAVMALYEGRPAHVELMLDGGRILIFGLVGSRQLDGILARLAKTGHLAVVPAPQDARVRLVLPTARMLEHDLDWLRAHYLAHATIFGEAAYARPLARDPAYQRAVRAAAVETFQAAAGNVIEQNPAILYFLARSAGLLILMKLIRLAGGADGQEVRVSHAELARQFGVSRTHVRDLLTEAGGMGLVVRAGPGRLSLTPGLLDAFDRHLANGMSLQDFGHQAAMVRLARA